MGSSYSKKSDGFDPLQDTVPLHGKVAIVTGGNAGLGYTTILNLARRGCKVYLAARNEERGRNAIRKLKQEGLGPGNGEIVFLHLDLADLHGTHAVAAKFLKLEDKLDILINNACLSLVEFHVGATGISDVMLVNYFGHFVFTQALLPLLEQTASKPGADVRIINMSSISHGLIPDTVRFRNKADFNVRYDEMRVDSLIMLARYGASKLAILLYNMELQRRLNEHNSSIICVSVHPGNVATEGAAQVRNRRCGFIIYYLFRLLQTTADKGCLTMMFAAASPEVRAHPEKYQGKYMMPVGKIKYDIGGKSKPSKDMSLAKELWETTIRILEELRVGA